MDRRDASRIVSSVCIQCRHIEPKTLKFAMMNRTVLAERTLSAHIINTTEFSKEWVLKRLCLVKIGFTSYSSPHSTFSWYRSQQGNDYLAPPPQFQRSNYIKDYETDKRWLFLDNLRRFNLSNRTVDSAVSQQHSCMTATHTVARVLFCHYMHT